MGIGKGANRAASAGVLVLAVGLSGCVAAAIPLYYAASAGLAAYSGFTVYKSVQLTRGGSVSVTFPGKDGKAAPAQPLPVVRRVAVWPENEGEVLFAERLSKSGHYDVTPPARVSVILADAKIAKNLKELTQTEQTTAFNTVCKISVTSNRLSEISLNSEGVATTCA